MTLRLVYLIAILIASHITMFSIGLDQGYKIGLRRCRADRLIEGLSLERIECKYKKGRESR